MLGEKVTTEISKQELPDTFNKNKKVARWGGDVAGKARKETENQLGRSVVSEQNYLTDSPAGYGHFLKTEEELIVRRKSLRGIG